MADTNRNDVAGLIQDAYSNTFLDSASGTSTVLQTFPTVNLGTKTTNLPVLSTIPHAKWVGESATDASGVKPTAKATWTSKTLVVEELAVILPVHENVIADATTDVLGDLAKMGGRAIAYALDAAVIFGWQKPVTWTSNSLYKSAVDAGNVEVIGDAVDGEDLSGSILKAAEDVAIYYDPSKLLGHKGLRFRLANQRDTNGQTVYQPNLSGTPGDDGTVHGLSTGWVQGTVDDGAGGDRQLWDRARIEAMVVDPNQVRIGVRQDISVKLLDQATVNGINLAERDMVALRFCARYAYALGDIYADGTQTYTHSPVAVVTPGQPVVLGS